MRSLPSLPHLLAYLVHGRAADPRAVAPLGAAPGNAAAHPPRLTSRVIIPEITPEQQEAPIRAAFSHAQRLARQDQWQQLGECLRKADKAGDVAIGGDSIANILAAGARSDMVTAAADAVAVRRAPCARSLADLDEVADDHADCWTIATIIALTHLDIAWLMTGGLPPTRRTGGFGPAARHHADRATDLIGRAAKVSDSAFLAAARADLLMCRARTPDPEEIEKAHLATIALAPHAPGPIRLLGTRLSARWGAAAGVLELAAGRVATRLKREWGNGAYALALMDPLLDDPALAARIDVARFVSGMSDALHLCPDPALANEFAALTALHMSPDRAPGDLSAAARMSRNALHAAARSVIAHHLRDLRPQVWTGKRTPLTPLPPKPVEHVETALAAARAKSAIATCFASEIARGNMLIFGPGGMRCVRD